ncbi:MAG: winged helix-turn-helix domain-containing protein [Colwellia sp.]|nr:winged helix-turn-helix domain-containing protein [Colwellia sp.]
MTQKFWLDKTYVDPSRNEIKRGQELTVMAPKVIAVLSLLAKNQGEVVTIDALMEHVWRDSVVSPSTLQQCITKLRKVLGDDGKQQKIIKTHAKKGYSLEVDVTWDDSLELLTLAAEQQKGFNFRPYSFWFVGLILFFISLYLWNVEEQHQPLSFDVLTPLTATDEKETVAQYSPDGSYIIFQRSNGFCGNSLWAKDLKNHQEYPLIKGVGACSSGSFSADGKQFIFMSKTTSKLREIADNCFNLMKINLKQAFIKPQIPELVLGCSRGPFDEPLWLNNGSIVLLKYQGNNAKLIKYSLVNDELTDFYSSENTELYSATYSPELDLIAVVGLNKSSEHILSILNSHGEVQSSTVIKRPKRLALYQFVFPSFDAKRKQLIFNSAKALYTLSFSGEVTKINANINSVIYSPRFHPNGQSIIATQGVFDSDIAEVLLTKQESKQESQLATKQVAPKFNQVYTPYTSIERSIYIERDAKYQPSGEGIAFISNRSGGQQLWLKGQGYLKQLSHFKTDSIIQGYSWAPDGRSILIAVNAELYRLTLEGIAEQVELAQPVLGIYGWAQNDIILLKIRKAGVPALTRYSLKQDLFLDTIARNFRWAAINLQGHIVYLDNKNQFWQLSTTEAELIVALQVASTIGSFVLSGDKIYSINKDQSIWTFNLENNHYQVIRTINEAVTNISDVQDKILITQAISAKKDVIELSSSN